MPNAEAVLVDTHVVLWWQAGGERLSPGAARRLDRADTVYISPITCWEIAMLVAKGRVGLDRPVEPWVNDLLATTSVDIAELTPAVAISAGQLVEFHGDPADRIIYATAASLHVPLITKDSRLHDFAATAHDVDVVW